MKLERLCKSAGINCPENLKDIEITSVVSDSRKVEKNSIFVALSGTKDDGDRYADEARAKGAVVVSETSVGDMVCKDAHRTLAFLCRELYGGGIEKLKFAAVTGTNGKTTHVELMKNIFEENGKKVGTIGTLGCFSPSGQIKKDLPYFANMTTPDPEMLYPVLSEMAADGAEYVFIEASSHALAKKKLDALRFDVGVLTNLTRDHLDFHKTFENYLEAKLHVLELCDKFIVNADDKNSKLFGRTLTCSECQKADFTAENTEFYGFDGCSYDAVFGNEKIRIKSRIPGGFTVMNTLEAVAAAATLGASRESIAKGIAKTTCVPGRMEDATPIGADFRVFIDYAHTPDALENVLKTLKRFINGRVIVLFGCGGDRDRGKRRLMGEVASKYADFAVITSDNSRSEPPESIINDILTGFYAKTPHKVIPDRREAIFYAVKNAKRGDVLLLAGKGHEKYEINSTGKIYFDEKEYVMKAWEEK